MVSSRVLIRGGVLATVLFLAAVTSCRDFEEALENCEQEGNCFPDADGDGLPDPVPGDGGTGDGGTTGNDGGTTGNDGGTTGNDGGPDGGMPDSGTPQNPDSGTPQNPDSGTQQPPDAGGTEPPDAGGTEPPDAGGTEPPDAGTGIDCDGGTTVDDAGFEPGSAVCDQVPVP
jgi:hypothetical protein